jgi:hypothetical protein
LKEEETRDEFEESILDMLSKLTSLERYDVVGYLGFEKKYYSSNGFAKHSIQKNEFGYSG